MLPNRIRTGNSTQLRSRAQANNRYFDSVQNRSEGYPLSEHPARRQIPTRQSMPDARSRSIDRAREIGRNLAKSQLDELTLEKQVEQLDHQIKEENYIPSYLRVEEMAM